MATLSLNGNFNNPVELKQTLLVNGNATFKSGFSQGDGNYVHGQHAFVIGSECSGFGDYSTVIGYHSKVGESSAFTPSLAYANGNACIALGYNSYALGNNATSVHDNSFVWQGNDHNIGDGYESQGEGTFCIRPYGGTTNTDVICGFFVGDKCITEYISSIAANRILTNPNVFTEIQTFSSGAIFGDDESGNVFDADGNAIFHGSVEFRGNTQIFTKNEYSDLSDSGNYVADHYFATMKALSAISSVGLYYDDGRMPDGGFATSLDFVRTYVTSAINDTASFYDTASDDKRAATERYVNDKADWASTHLLTSDNVFKGKNTFDTELWLGRNAAFYAPNGSMVDLHNSTVKVKDPDVNENNVNTIASEKYVKSNVVSAMEQILNHGNVYTPIGSNEFNTYSIESRFYSPLRVFGRMTLENGATANLTNGTVTVAEPDINTNKANEASTTRYARSIAASAIQDLLRNGGNFLNGSTVRFSGTTQFDNVVDLYEPQNAQLLVKTRQRGDNSHYAASTEYVERLVSDTIATSAVSVRDLLFNGNYKGGTFSENRFNLKTSFQDTELFVKTMEDSCADEHAASCEFVKRAIGDHSVFDLFDTKFTDHVLPASSPWKMQGSTIYGNTAAYNHIINDWDSTSDFIDYSIPGTSYTVRCKRAADGHLIVDAGNSTAVKAVNNVFDKTGIAWFYIIYRIRSNPYVILPRTKYGFKGIGYESATAANNVGKYVRPSIPSHTHELNLPFCKTADTGPYPHHGGSTACQHGTGGLETGTPLLPDGSLVTTGSTVQPPATNMILYFYCG